MHDWKDAEVLVLQAGASFAAGRYAEAESALRRALCVIPDEPEWLFNHGLTLELLGRQTDAAVSFARSYRFLDHDRATLRGHDTLGHEFADASDRTDNTESDDDDLDMEFGTDHSLDMSAELGPDFGPDLGHNHDPRRTPGSDASRRPKASSPAAAVAALRVGVNLMGVTDTRRAIRWFRRAIQLDRKSAEAHTGLITALGQQGHASEAETAFFEAQQDVEDDARIYVAIAGVLIHADKRERAIWCLREASRLDPSLPEVRRTLARIFADSNRYERARQLYLSELRQDPGDTATLLDLGRLLVRMNRPDEASEKFRRVLELIPDHPDGHYALGDLAESTGDDANAMRGFEVLTRLDPDHRDVRRRLASLLLKRGTPRDLIAARDLLRRERAVLRRRPIRDTEEDLHQLAILMIRSDLCGEAVPLLEQIIHQFDQASTDKGVTSGTTHGATKRRHEHAPQGHSRDENRDQATEAKPSRLNARAALVYHHLSVARFELAELAPAMDAARDAVRLDPRLTPAMHNLALGHMREGQWDRARHWTRRAARVDPDDPTIARLSTRLRLRLLISCWRVLTRFVPIRSR